MNLYNMYTLNMANRNRWKCIEWTWIWQCEGISDETIELVSERFSLCVLWVIGSELVSLWLGCVIGRVGVIHWLIRWLVDWLFQCVFVSVVYISVNERVVGWEWMNEGWGEGLGGWVCQRMIEGVSMWVSGQLVS